MARNGYRTIRAAAAVALTLAVGAALLPRRRRRDPVVQPPPPRRPDNPCSRFGHVPCPAGCPLATSCRVAAAWNN